MAFTWNGSESAHSQGSSFRIPSSRGAKRSRKRRLLWCTTAFPRRKRGKAAMPERGLIIASAPAAMRGLLSASLSGTGSPSSAKMSDTRSATSGTSPAPRTHASRGQMRW